MLCTESKGKSEEPILSQYVELVEEPLTEASTCLPVSTSVPTPVMPTAPVTPFGAQQTTEGSPGPPPAVFLMGAAPPLQQRRPPDGGCPCQPSPL